MLRVFSGEIDAFPSYESIYISLTPVDYNEEGDDEYEVELPMDGGALANFLRQVRAMSDMETPFKNFMQTARDIMERHTGQFYTDQDNIAAIIDKYRQDFTPEHEFPGGSGESSLDLSQFFITESVVLKEDSIVNGAVLPEGTRITFYHKGSFE